MPTAAQQGYVNQALASGYAQTEIDEFLSNNPNDYGRLLTALAPTPGSGATMHPADVDPLVNALPYGPVRVVSDDPMSRLTVIGNTGIGGDSGGRYPVPYTTGTMYPDATTGNGVTAGAAPNGLVEFLSRNMLIVLALTGVVIYFIRKR